MSAKAIVVLCAQALFAHVVNTTSKLPRRGGRDFFKSKSRCTPKQIFAVHTNIWSDPETSAQLLFRHSNPFSYAGLSCNLQ
ncbi:unnamed protein product [Arctia plantaginis]|uniref:Secreted protein n=1 Tax=Arctia plantaginis TaxID=874455 RepID=A0A8S1A655_ARCPL|nr:unnamed protein product [Arctia plantaginis]